MPDANRLDAYHFYEQSWDDYDALLSAFDWQVPDSFNLATYVCDRWAGDRRPALVADRGDGTERYSFERLDREAGALASFLAGQGVERGDRVGVNLRQRPETVVAHVACWKLGAVSVPLSTLFGTDALAYRLGDADVRACLVGDANADTLRSVTGEVDGLDTIVAVGLEPGPGETAYESVVETDRTVATVDTDAEDDAIIIYTSGTTGEPKGVRHAHRVLLGNLPLFLTGFCNMDLRDDDVLWTPAEWAWVATLFDVVFPGLFYGRPVVADTVDAPFDPERAMAVIDRHDVSLFFAPPTALRAMQATDLPDRDVASVRCVPSGGESLGETVVQWAAETFDGAAVHEGYGQTEANMLVGDCTALYGSREGKIGRRAPGHEITIVDPETAKPTVETGDVGEIAVKYDGDPVCFKEYWRKPDATDRKVQHGWLLTEDLGKLDADGYLEFVARKDNVIISAGYRIGPVEIEEALAAHQAVADAGVIGVPDDRRGEVPKAFVVLVDGYEPSETLAEELRDDVRDRLAEYEYPREVAFIDELPTTTTGKVRRVDLEAREGLRES